jgi:hypothetical protein
LSTRIAAGQRLDFEVRAECLRQLRYGIGADAFYQTMRWQHNQAFIAGADAHHHDAVFEFGAGPLAAFFFSWARRSLR